MRPQSEPARGGFEREAKLLTCLTCDVRRKTRPRASQTPVVHGGTTRARPGAPVYQNARAIPFMTSIAHLSRPAACNAEKQPSEQAPGPTWRDRSDARPERSRLDLDVCREVKLKRRLVRKVRRRG